MAASAGSSATVADASCVATCTPRVGNDVVDLAEAVNATAHLRPRFVARVCGEQERARVAASRDPNGLLWSLFAAKEAAYKAISKALPGIAFAHRRFEVSENLRSVRYDALSAHLRVWRAGDCIQAIAHLGDARLVHGVEQVQQGDDLSVAVRHLLCSSIAEREGLDASDLAVVRAPLADSWTGFAPPVLTYRGRPTNRDISLSHDGRFVAWAGLAQSGAPTGALTMRRLSNSSAMRRRL